MKSFKEDILLSRLLQLSLFGSLLIIGLLLAFQEHDIQMPDFILSEDIQEMAGVEKTDSLDQSAVHLWLRHSADWMDAHLLEPIRKWK